MNIEVRDIQENDFEAVNTILMDAFSCERESVTGDMFHEIVALADGVVAGYLLLTKVINPLKKRCYYLVDYVCVSSDFRGHGIGKQLLDKAYQIAKEDNALYLQLTCSRFRIAAHKLYEKCNFIKRDSDIFRKEIV